MSADPEIHYVSLPTTDADGNPSGQLRIPVVVHPGLRENQSLRAEMSPQHMAWFSQAVLEAAAREKYPLFAKLFEGHS